MKLTSLADDARIALDNLVDFAGGLAGGGQIRLGVAGLARAGKTVFITSLVHNLVHGGRLPLFEPWRSQRLIGAELKPQLHDDVPTFDYRSHVRQLVDQRTWPESTRQIAEMRLTIAYESATFLGRNIGAGKLHLDIVDYPGEWLLDLPLLGKDFRTWSREAIDRARSIGRSDIAGAWLAALPGHDPAAPESDEVAAEAARLFTAYLAACRADTHALSLVPPGRFLMPGDLEGSPALTFAPLLLPGEGGARKDSLWAMMERRYEAYKQVVVKPFFRTHFARLDRQVVLIDALAALNAGPAAVADLALALEEILACFRPGRSSWLGSVLSRRIDRILIAATKADHLHHTSHDRLEKLMSRILRSSIDRARDAGASVEVKAIAAVRATREASVRQGGETLPCILGIPQAGETIDGRRFDGSEEIALFPGDLPEDPEVFFQVVESLIQAAHARIDALHGDGAQVENPIHDVSATNPGAAGLNPAGRAGPWSARRSPVEAAGSLVPDLRFLRFRPPRLEVTAEGTTLSLPHIRLDRAIDFLIGDKLA
ncbi:YcjX family GTP-binding protein [Methylobrevis albus]|uniref:YcjX family protein n=1 Tax=Methylobrevis albus TaxID=2793297 RepID=A0A931I009_9HYPH|nr:YcjX family protein [Methylobrevis albus]MBH0236840.1 YcjX family protein [Methylobrevis albus]